MVLGTTIVPFLSIRGIAICLQPPPAIHPLKTHLLKQIMPHGIQLAPLVSHTVGLVCVATLVVSSWNLATQNNKSGKTNQKRNSYWEVPLGIQQLQNTKSIRIS